MNGNYEHLNTLRKEREIMEMKTEHKLMKKALFEIAKHENSDHAKWVLHVLFGEGVEENDAE